MSSPVRAAPADPAAASSFPALSDKAALPVACFSVQGRADPGLMLRVLELFAKRNLIPVRWHSYVSEDAEDAALVMDFQVAGLETRTLEHAAACMRGFWGVTSVLTWRN